MTKKLLNGIFCFVLFTQLNAPIGALNNGLALTPPMGWSSWVLYKCQITENIIRRVADIMYSDGYLRVGYNYVLIDDCWQNASRDSNGRLQSDPVRFPSGIKLLADYVHSRGLRLGLFTDLGRLTSRLMPGSEGYYELDAKTFAEWGVDYVKIAAASAAPQNLDTQYAQFVSYLNKSGRPMIIATSWAAYQLYNNIPINYNSIVTYSNSWRIYGDMQNSWQSIAYTIQYSFAAQLQLNRYTGPGSWSDLDVLILGNGALSISQSRAQMVMWSILASPLILSNDLTAVPPEIKVLLQNYLVIQINQDQLGIRGVRVDEKDGLQIWIKPVMPIVNTNYYSYAVAFLNTRVDSARRHSFSFQDIGLNSPNGYFVTDLLQDTNLYNQRYMTTSEAIDMLVAPTGVAFFKIEPAYYRTG